MYCESISNVDAALSKRQTRACVASQLLNVLIVCAVVHMDALERSQRREIKNNLKLYYTFQ
jgi:hypothetical protein